MKKIIDKILRLLLLFVTAIWGLFFNLFGGIALITNEENMLLDIYPNIMAIGIALIATTAVCFITGTVLVMLDKSLIAAIFSIVGTISLLVIYGQFAALETNVDFMTNHMPSIIITILTVIIAAIENYDHFLNRAHERDRKLNDAAPSILGGTYIPDEENVKPLKKNKGKK